MNIKEPQIASLIQDLETLIGHALESENDSRFEIDDAFEGHIKSARNLIHYRSFRKYDLRKLQKKLGNLGLSRFARAEAHVMASLLNTKLILNHLINNNEVKATKAGLSIKNGHKLLVRNTKNLLGFRSKSRRVRIMVTLPTEAADDYQLVHNMIKGGMNCARINCAHDGLETWKKIINHIKKASLALKREVKIAMDLAGPKIRTDEIVKGARVRKFTPERNEEGKVIEPAVLLLIPELEIDSPENALPVDLAWINALEIGEELSYEDTRGKRRKATVFEVGENYASAYSYDSSYIRTDQIIRSKKGETTVGELPEVEHNILLKVGDSIDIHKDGLPGEPASYNNKGELLKRAHISCQLKEVFDSIKIGDPILFDDGKIEGKVIEAHPDQFTVEVTRARLMGSKLKAEKGINFPDTKLNVSGLTEKDREDLQFVVQHADIINFSFVNSPEDVKDLLDYLKQIGASEELGLILKIETRSAYDNLIDILLEAMKVKNLGVMIARGDLAVETGWEHIGKIQKEILSICAAGHVPVIWATQVLENLAKKGLPSRSEITDAASAIKAECVMLNKGPYILDAIRLLNTMLSDLERFNYKNEALLPKLEKTL